MGNQQFCNYCGVDTRLEHRDNCPQSQFDELRGCEHDWSKWRPIVFSVFEVFEWRVCTECRTVEWKL